MSASYRRIDRFLVVPVTCGTWGEKLGPCAYFMDQDVLRSVDPGQEEVIDVTETRTRLDELGAFYPGGEPLPESCQHERVRSDVAMVLEQHFSTRGDVLVASNLNVYHREGDPAAVVEPDVLLVTGVAVAELRYIESYRTFQHGGLPVFVLEVLEHESVLAEMAYLREAEYLREDLDYKRAAYTAIGVAEYWRVDPTGGELHPEVLQGERLHDGHWTPIAVTVDNDGAWRGRGGALDLDIAWYDDELLFYQDRRDEPLPNLARSLAALRAAEASRRAAEAGCRATEATCRAERNARLTEQKARREAEAEAAALAVENARLRELLRNHLSPKAGPPPDPPG